jgi:ABC-type multidrug transport system permease subunit
LRSPLRVERLVALTKRELTIRASYRMTAILGLVSGLSGLLVYGLLGGTAIVSVTSQDYGMGLASFLVSGVAFSSIITSGPSLFAQYSSPSQLEEVLVTPTGFKEFLLTSSFLNILESLGTAIIFFALSILLLGLNFSYNLPVLSIVLVLGVLASIGLGFVSLGFQLVYKQTSLVTFVLFSLTGLVGNMVVPVQVLPSAVQFVSRLTPQYYFFTGIRVALGSNVSQPGLLLALLALYSLVLLAAGLVVLDQGLRFVRRNGTHRWT